MRRLRPGVVAVTQVAAKAPAKRETNVRRLSVVGVERIIGVGGIEVRAEALLVADRDLKNEWTQNLKIWGRRPVGTANLDGEGKTALGFGRQGRGFRMPLDPCYV